MRSLRDPLAHLPPHDRDMLLRTIALRNPRIRNLAALAAVIIAGSWVAVGTLLFGDFGDYGALHALLLYLTFGGGVRVLGRGAS